MLCQLRQRIEVMYPGYHLDSVVKDDGSAEDTAFRSFGVNALQAYVGVQLYDLIDYEGENGIDLMPKVRCNMADWCRGVTFHSVRAIAVEEHPVAAKVHRAVVGAFARAHHTGSTRLRKC